VGKVYAGINERNAAFIRAQHVFFVATAPTRLEGHLNLSPKGLDAFRILDPRTVAYLDLTGSGIETVAHLKENGRIVLMFCAFEGAPRILRLHGRGEVLVEGDREFGALLPLFPRHPGTRAIIRVRLDRISDSCGFGVPLYRYEGERTQFAAWAEHKGPEGLAAYRDEKNQHSIDGLPGLSMTP
jgi:Pyridoxamine 5'-phosphate oxidase